MLDDKLLDSVRSGRMSVEQVRKRTAQLPFLFGPNYVPANCSSQLHFWSPQGFKPEIIDKELGVAKAVGINTLRVFFHDLHFTHDRKGYRTRINEFLDIAAANKIRPMFTLFDSCWNPEPKLGHYPPPIPGKHNSRWTQSPGAATLKSPTSFAALQPYVEWYAGELLNDPRVLPIADLWNEPDNAGGSETGSVEQENRAELVAPYLLNVFKWARAANPEIMLTSGIWRAQACRQLERDGGLNEVEIVQRACSDLPSFHCYEHDIKNFESRIDWLEIDDEGNKRPVLCSEWMQRGCFQPGQCNSIETLLPMMKHRLMGSMPWGLVTGDTQTHIPWNNVETGIPHHDLFKFDSATGLHQLHYPEEGNIIRSVMTGETFAAKAAPPREAMQQILMRPPVIQHIAGASLHP